MCVLLKPKRTNISHKPLNLFKPSKNHSMRVFKIIGKILLGLLTFILIFLAFTIAPVDRTDYREMSYYQEMNKVLDNWKPAPDTSQNLKAGWAKINLTPSKPTPTAGYGDRHGKPYQSIHDSVYVRAIVIQTSRKPIAIVSCDLLIFPPEVTISLKEKLKSIGFDWSQVYVGTTHTHNSLGAWGKNSIGELFAGKYDQNTVDFMVDKVLEAIQKASQNLVSAKTGYGEIDAKELVFNRLVGNKSGTIDPFVRILKIEKQTGETAILTTFSAHATTLNADKNFLSADYPGEYVQRLSNAVNFATFMAGSVGSSGPVGEELKDDFMQMKNLSEGLSAKVLKEISNIKVQQINQLSLSTFPVALREPQVRFAENWRFRPWVFKTFFGDYPAEIKALRIGKTVMIGTPCDYSGELMPEIIKTAQNRNLNLIVTSFDGSYIGYITHDRHYDLNAYETRVMNWYGPQNGIYFQEIIKKILRKL
jgi:neutral ceramidase